VKIVVCLKQVPATDSRIRISGDGRGVELSSVDWVVNPYDEFAMEEALRLKEKLGGEVHVVSIGGEKVEDAMRTALALGADGAIVLKDATYAEADALSVSRALAALVRRAEAEVVFCGKQAVDDDRMAVPAMLAELLDWPQVTVAVGFEASEDGAGARVQREIEGGREVVEVAFPAVIAAQKGLNEPRYASLKGIMAAKKKPIEVVTAADLALEAPGDAIEVLDVTAPPAKTGARMIEGDASEQVAELVRILHEEKKLV